MGNLSYCRFQNTARDLADCVEAIECDEIQDLDPQELNGLKKLLEFSQDIVAYAHIIDEVVDNN